MELTINGLKIQKCADFEVGTKVWAIGFYGQNGEKFHAMQTTIGLTEDGKHGIAVLPFFACDGEKQHQGNGGLYRGAGGVLCEVNTGNDAAYLDTFITCEQCRANLGLAPLHSSVHGSATLAARIADKKAQKAHAVTVGKIEYNQKMIAMYAADVAKNEALCALTDEEFIAAKVADSKAYAEKDGSELSAESLAWYTELHTKNLAKDRAQAKHYVKVYRAQLKQYTKKLAQLEAAL